MFNRKQYHRDYYQNVIKKNHPIKVGRFIQKGRLYLFGKEICIFKSMEKVGRDRVLTYTKFDKKTQID